MEIVSLFAKEAIQYGQASIHTLAMRNPQTAFGFIEVHDESINAFRTSIFIDLVLLTVGNENRSLDAGSLILLVSLDEVSSVAEKTIVLHDWRIHITVLQGDRMLQTSVLVTDIIAISANLTVAFEIKLNAVFHLGVH